MKEQFNDLNILSESIKGLKVILEDPDLDIFKEEVFGGVKEKYTKESLRDIPIFRAYRDFFWKIGIDPTKNRPASEALIRRILQNKPIPKINTLVDSYNLASIKSCIGLAAFDEDTICEEMVLRFSMQDEKFHGIGMKKPMILKGGEIVISDEEKLIAVYPHRDSDETKVTLKTENLLLLACGVPGISDKVLIGAMDTAIEYIDRFCKYYDIS
ncbi:MAG: phenylalanine--tRNA ligase beta subunit-related protein [Halobacteriota archaeon]|nr:phenylalanine--tRNA ligase beta subunit-related protein [Halobacteriota archaeon]